MRKILSLVIMVLITGMACAKDYSLSNFDQAKEWGITLGREFPGAKGKLALNKSGKLELSYDFTGGGKYIAIWFKKRLPEKVNEFFIDLKANQQTSINYRLVDSTKRYFQGRASVISTVEKKVFKTTGPWSAAWGGKKSKQPVTPFKTFFLMITADKKLLLKGQIELNNFGFASDVEQIADFTGNDSSLTIPGWQVNLEWQPQITEAKLKVSAEGSGNAELSFSFPEMGRDKVFHKTLTGNGGIFYYNPPLINGGNLYNQYKIVATLRKQDGTSATTVLTLSGRKSEGNNFGAPVSSDQIESSTFGVCTHFNYGRLPHWSFWAPYKELVDGISQCGYKWVRDGCSVKKQSDGSYKVIEHDLNWIKYAKSKGLNVIICVRLYPDKSIDEYKKYVEAIVQDTRGMVNVFELGNEPHNFGWKPKYKGHWNGYDPKTKKTEKWVKEHAKYTNALADHIKKKYPDAIVIGLGSGPCTNLLELKEGITKNLDGVAEHPYTYSMPPEKIPFGKSHLKRDGVLVSENGLFSEMIETYENEFKREGIKRSLWLTEFGFTTFWFSGKNEKGLYAGFTEKTQAIYLVRRFIHGMTFPIVKVACQYDYIDDYNSKEFNAEANFGIIRADHSRKPSYYAIQRMNSLFNGYQFNSSLKCVVEKQPLHRSCKRGALIKDWDSATLKANNDISAYGFSDSNKKPMIAVWSNQPHNDEFNNRVCTIRIKNMKQYASTPVGIDIISGRSFDIPVKVDGNDLVFNNLILKHHPIVIKLFK